MLIKTLPVGQLETNCYVVTDEDSLDCAVIDPGDESGTILDYLEDNKLHCRAVLLTHAHFDHVGAANALLEATGARLYMCEKELELVKMCIRDSPYIMALVYSVIAYVMGLLSARLLNVDVVSVVKHLGPDVVMENPEIFINYYISRAPGAFAYFIELLLRIMGMLLYACLLYTSRCV